MTLGATSPVVLTNVANGQLNASSTDAVNGVSARELYATNQSISDISGDITNMNGKLQTDAPFCTTRRRTIR
ncbi:hypothetical protein [Paraburkholderia sp. A3RO-2L]|uniref:hypothetical protein n=1 Tax=Paraburkholderia sp. A3RO-2L TaxID=3028376 RepID=UPI003DA8458C